MNKKAVKGRYLIGYDGDEHFMIWIKQSQKVIMSRDVQFEEKPGGCVEQVKLPLKDVQKKESTKDESEDSLKEKESESDTENYQTGTDTDTENDQELCQEDNQIVKLRDRSFLERPMLS